MAAKRNQAAYDLLRELLAEADAGRLDRLFVVFRDGDGDYAHDYATDDLDDLILQVRTEVIVAQSESGLIEVPVH